MKNLRIFGGFFFKTKIADISNFQWIRYLSKGLSYLKNWDIGACYCWNYESSKLLLHFIEYHLGQFHNKHMKIAVNSAIQCFEGYSQKKCLLKVPGFLVHPLQNGGPVELLQNWTESIFSNFTNIIHLV